MSFRLTRHLYHRICPVGSVKTLFVLPIFHGETMGKLNGQVKLNSTPDISEGGTTSAAGPFGCIEYAFSVFFVPWTICSSYLKSTGSQPSVPSKVREFDDLMRKLVLTYGSTASSVFYNPDSSAATDKLSMDPAGADNSANRAGEPIVQPDYPALGPQGVLRITNYERMLSSMTKIDAGIASASTTVYTGDTTFNDMVYHDQIDLDMDIGISTPGYLIATITRHDINNPTLGYAAAYGTEDTNATYAVGAADRISMLSALFHGDQLFIKELLRNKSLATSQYLETLLYRGDVSLEPLNTTNNPSLAALYSDNNVFRKNDISVQCKMMCEYATPYTVVPDLM